MAEFIQESVDNSFLLLRTHIRDLNETVERVLKEERAPIEMIAGWFKQDSERLKANLSKIDSLIDKTYTPV